MTKTNKTSKNEAGRNRAAGLTVPDDLVLQLRKILPKRPLTYGEALNVARFQAARLRKLLGVASTAMPLKWTTDLPNLRLHLVAAHELDEGISGLTTRNAGGDYVVAINRSNSLAHQRFSLAHEIKHVLDFPYAETLYQFLGYGDDELREQQVERVCHHFAAHLLMPTMLVKRAWTMGIQDLKALAGLFKVSEDAMTIRLRTLGFIGGRDEQTVIYYRRAVLTRSDLVAV